MIITKEMLFDNNVKQIVKKIMNDYDSEIKQDFEYDSDRYEDVFTWLESHPEIVGRAFMNHIINYGFTNEDLISDK